MTTIRKTITLTGAQNDWIKAQIDSGAYTNDSEVLRDLIRKAQQERADIEAVRAALIEGERSGLGARSPEDIRAAVKARISRNA
ncbi:type II toxin-antitoxin system ParD family antitoxin [Phenylobacterium sp.]|uniref:type II toxin-antitoxin system ParD family antitoxin n=1 Tax=Phenylobacterium sp. TaxID=1871053 RepID=UPI00301D0A32